MKKVFGTILGAILICCGVVYILGVFGLADPEFSLDGWWTLFIIVPCFNGLLTDKNKLGSLLGLAIGVLLLLAARGVLEYGIILKIIIPAIIVVLGIKLIVKSLSTPKSAEKDTSCNQKELTALFSEQNADYSGEELTSAKIGAIFGGAKCNLKNSEIKDQCKMNLLCAFGGVEITVPENVNIKSNMLCIFGGVSDKRKNNTDANITIYLDGFCMFGGIDIK